MKKGLIFLMVVGGLAAVLGLEGPSPDPVGVVPAIAYFRTGSREFASRAVKLEKAIGSIRKGDTLTLLRAKGALEDCRLSYKKIEFFLEYFFRSVSVVYNAPPKVEVEEPNIEYAEPTGLQVIESLLFGKDVFGQEEALSQQAAMVSNSALDLGSLLYDFKADDRQVLESLRFELIRIIALGITGFDAPALKSGIPESRAALQSMREILRPYLDRRGMCEILSSEQETNDNGYSPVDSVSFYLGRSLQLLGQGSDFVEEDGNFEGRDSNFANAGRDFLKRDHHFAAQGSRFDSFDRMAFLTGAALPLQQYLGEWIHKMGLDLNTDPVLNPQAKNIFSPDAFNVEAFPHARAPDSSTNHPDFHGDGSAASDNPYLIELGRRLFFEKALSGNYSRNCASCHEPANYFTDGRTKSLAYDGHSTVKRNAPTLLYAAYQYNEFLDGRARSLEDQVKEVMHSPTEMNADYDTVCRRLQVEPDYISLYAKAFPQSGKISGVAIGAVDRITLNGIAAAIAAFVRTLAPRNSDFDRYLAGDKKALTERQVRGFNLFMGKAQCATCHYAPLFNGLTPPLYDRSEFEVLGVPSTDEFAHAEADRDSGRYAVFPIPFYNGAFRTPGLRNIAVTAPYMHHGAFRTLEKVLDFYNRGGGAGLGLNFPLQTLSSTPLGLTDDEKKDIIDFLHGLTDRLPKKF